MKHSVRSLAATCLLLGFILGLHNGRVALWKSDDPQPIKIFPWSASFLPDNIRSALEKGIYVEEDSDIGILIQDMIC